MQHLYSLQSVHSINRTVLEVRTNTTTHMSHTNELSSRAIIALSSYYTLLYLIDRPHLELPMLQLSEEEVAGT